MPQSPPWLGGTKWVDLYTGLRVFLRGWKIKYSGESVGQVERIGVSIADFFKCAVVAHPKALSSWFSRSKESRTGTR